MSEPATVTDYIAAYNEQRKKIDEQAAEITALREELGTQAKINVKLLQEIAALREKNEGNPRPRNPRLQAQHFFSSQASQAAGESSEDRTQAASGCSQGR